MSVLRGSDPIHSSWDDYFTVTGVGHDTVPRNPGRRSARGATAEHRRRRCIRDRARRERQSPAFSERAVRGCGRGRPPRWLDHTSGH